MTMCIGLMSGTSLDGVDGVLVAFDGSLPLRVLGHEYRPFDATLRAELLALNTPGTDELHRAALAGNAVARRYAAVVGALLQATGVDPSDVQAIGAHGQTVRHRPGEFDGIGYTLQLNAPALLAELTGIDVIADLRSRDVAAGGSGAPLAPGFHRTVFAKPGATVAVLNIGGISNLTVLPPDTDGAIGFDCGPGNVLMDLWCERHTQQAFDADGAWAASGRVVHPLLDTMLAEPFLAAPAPKSTGRDLFNARWLEAHLQAIGTTSVGPHSASAEPAERAEEAPASTASSDAVAPRDVQATLAELTARTCADAVRRHGAGARELLVCGGGALNGDLMRRLAAHLPGVLVDSTARAGIPPMQVEACAFAWLAQAHLERRAGNLTAVTGADGPRVLGALYPGPAAD